MTSIRQRGLTIRKICEAMRRRYKGVVQEGSVDPLERVLLAILSEGALEKDALAILEKLRHNFVDWNELRAGLPDHLTAYLGHAEEEDKEDGRIHAIKNVLERVFAERARTSLDFLTEFSEKKARRYLLSVEGIGKQIVDKVLFRVLGSSHIPTNPHVARVLQRIGLIDSNQDDAKAIKEFERLMPKKLRLAYYELLLYHGERICMLEKTRCTQCLARKICEHRVEMATAKKSKTKKKKAAAKPARKTAAHKAKKKAVKKSKKATKVKKTKKKAKKAVKKRKTATRSKKTVKKVRKKSKSTKSSRSRTAKGKKPVKKAKKTTRKKKKR